MVLEECVLKNSLVGAALKEMDCELDQNIPSWLNNMRKIKQLLNIADPPNNLSPKVVGNNFKNKLQSKFDCFFLSQINQIKSGDDGVNHNKLRFYNTFKGSFTLSKFISSCKTNQQIYKHSISGQENDRLWRAQ